MISCFVFFTLLFRACSQQIGRKLPSALLQRFNECLITGAPTPEQDQKVIADAIFEWAREFGAIASWIHDISDQHFMINSKERGVLWNVFRDTFLIFAVWRRESIWMDWFRLILMQRLGNYVHWQQIDWTRLEEKDIDVATSHNGLVVRYRQSQWLHCLCRYPSIRQVVLCACGLGFVAYGPSMLTDVGIWFNALHRISGHSTNSLNHQHVPCR